MARTAEPERPATWVYGVCVVRNLWGEVVDESTSIRTPDLFVWKAEQTSPGVYGPVDATNGCAPRCFRGFQCPTRVVDRPSPSPGASTLSALALSIQCGRSRAKYAVQNEEHASRSPFGEPHVAARVVQEAGGEACVPAAVSDLVDSLDRVQGDHHHERSPRLRVPGSEVLGHPNTIADLLTKAATFSSSIIGQRRGASATANDIYEIIRSQPRPISPNEIVGELTRAGRPISDSASPRYLHELVDAGLVDPLSARDTARTPQASDESYPHGYLATPARSAQRAAPQAPSRSSVNP